MGRVKLEIKRIENSVSRHATFAKRKIGLVKKAQELATLCDIDIALIMFSPVDHLIHYPSDLKIQEIIMRYANVPLAERIKRKKENLEQLNRGIRKLKGDNEIARGMGFEDIEVLQKELARLQQENQILQNHLRLFQGDCASLDSLNYEELHQMELHIQTVMEKASLLKILDYNKLHPDMNLSLFRDEQHQALFMGDHLNPMSHEPQVGFPEVQNLQQEPHLFDSSDYTPT
ncbi:agamous-like MADS-box protein AGL104 [Selaginella moellendorffii]|uniref:MADS2 protein n=1 Tax=Selaginella moellendorffii TaxID=88036 RepID=G0KY99_SELML|nr:agamous-like MADS-box protein AGL104 [Selaginella moellendorffii]CAX46408.1 MADS2 protein [Selaginella moellendorffii]|eukprot:XP_024539268.1 agamous-like MADS-box protein AGL104 [Selaginella moellendorffii]